VSDPLVIDSGIHWAAVIVYVVATIANAYGLIFGKDKVERASYFIVVCGLFIHGVALLYRWKTAGHGPYMVRYEVLSSNAWIMMTMFLIFLKFFPKIRVASMLVFPATFLLIAMSLFFNPQVSKLPPTLRSIWLVLHVSFYKIALATILIGLALSILLILKVRSSASWISRVPEVEITDLYAYRFAGFGFVFWAIAMLAGSIWAYQSWGRFWGWDPIETWSLITWILFGIYLHLRHFFGWKREKAAYLFVLCFVIAVVSLFFIPLLESSVHSEYFL
jgi:cytochrome c-type biogenesis protein CcsB